MGRIFRYYIATKVITIQVVSYFIPGLLPNDYSHMLWLYQLYQDYPKIGKNKSTDKNPMLPKNQITSLVQP